LTFPAEPERSLEDTQPRRIEGLDEDEPRRGCVGTLFTSLLVLMMIFTGLGIIVLAGVAGWRDGGIARRTEQAHALNATLDRQSTLAWTNLGEGQFELAFNRCDYISTLQPLYPGANQCRATAQAALNASPTPTLTPTLIPPTLTPTISLTPPPAGAFNPEELLARAQEASRRSDYETAMAWLEALRAQDANYKRAEVESLLLKTYQALGSQYRFEGNYGAMIVVIEKALKINSLSDTDWGFTINAAKLYLSARGYLDAGNFGLAADVFRRLMSIAPTFSGDTKTLACKAFASAGDTGAFSQFGCQ